MILHRPNEGGLNSAHAGGRSSPLDALRGVAILLVLLRHNVLEPAEAAGWRRAFEPVHNLGWAGVDLFFVLSGFLVGGLLFDEWNRRGRIDYGRFFARRLFKIWPAYFLYLAYAAWWQQNASGWSGAQVLHAYLPTLLHVQNYFGTPELQTWSLAVEEHFYLALPLAVWLAIRAAGPAGVRRLPALLLAVMVACLSMRLLNLRHPFAFTTHFNPTHLRIDAVCAGVLLAHAHHFHRELLGRWTRRATPVLLPAAVLLLIPTCLLPERHPFIWTIGFTLNYAAFAILVAIAATLPPQFGRRMLRPLCGIGATSYAIYLWHFRLGMIPVRRALDGGLFGAEPTSGRFLLATGVYLCVAIATGAAMGLLIERPAMRLRQRWLPARGRDAVRIESGLWSGAAGREWERAQAA